MQTTCIISILTILRAVDTLYKEYLKSKGISIISVTQPIDNNNATGDLMTNIIFHFSQFENNLRKDMCTAGKIAYLENWDWYTAPLVGCRKDKTAAKKHQFVIDDKGELIVQAFKWQVMIPIIIQPLQLYSSVSASNQQ